MRQTATPAVPSTYRGHLLWGALLELQRDPLELLSRLAGSEGVVRCRAGPLRLFVVVGPEHVHDVLVNHGRRYGKQTRSYDVLRLALGNGLSTSEGDFWLRQRRLAQPAFHRRQIAGWGEMMVGATTRMVDSWGEHAARGVSFDVHRELLALTLHVVGGALFSSDLLDGARDQIGSALAEAGVYLRRRAHAAVGWPLWLPTPGNRRFTRSMKALDDVVHQLISRRRALVTRPADLLELLMSARDEETGESMTDAQLRDEVLTLMTAGHETTANALSWALYLLARHPDVEAAARAEVDRVLGSRPAAVDDLPRLALVDRILREAMRLYPPIWMFERSVHTEHELGGHSLRPGDTLLLSAWATHRSPSCWPLPEHFDPDRFLPEADARRPKLAYFPFSAGNRKCIGDGFASTEARLVLATLLQRTRLTLDEARSVVPEPAVILRPRDGLWMGVEIRR